MPFSSRIFTRFLPFAPLALAACIAACGDDQAPGEAQALWQRIHDENYRSWERAPGYEARRDSDAPHSDAVDIYVNEVVAGVLAAGEPAASWPDGSLIVKDGFDGSEHEIVAAMEKRGGTWFWAEWNAEGESIFSGNPSTCTDCHQVGSDMVRAFGLPMRR